MSVSCSRTFFVLFNRIGGKEDHENEEKMDQKAQFNDTSPDRGYGWYSGRLF
ncbi:MAG: hypothetical protein PWR19_1020 [Carnobacterium sp.]|nr:hypothetical protein [Carnobacterium sp.]